MIRTRILSIYLIIALTLVGLYYTTENAEVKGAEVIYVGPNSTHHTIQQAVDNASTGDTIIVENGTYHETVLIDKADITLIGNSSTDCHIMFNTNGSSILSNAPAAINVTADGATISGFNISVAGSFVSGFYLKASKTTILGNNVTTDGSMGYGLFTRNTGWQNITNNNFMTLNSYSIGISLYQNVPNSNIMNNTIYTKGQNAYGIQADRSSIVEIINNTVTTENQWSTGIFTDQGSFYKIMYNNVTTKFDNAYGIWVLNSNNYSIHNNSIFTSGNNAIGIYIVGTILSNITDNYIVTQNRHGIFLATGSNLNIITNNTAKIYGSGDNGIFITGSNFNNITDNEIFIKGAGSEGIHLFVNTVGNKVINNTITGTGSSSSRGVMLSSGATLSIVTNNRINISSTNGAGILLTGAFNNNVTSNEIITWKGTANGVYLMSSSTGNTFVNNTITTIGSSSYGFSVTGSSNSNNIFNNTIQTNGPNSYGINILDTMDTTVFNNTIMTTNSQGYGINLNGGTKNNLIENKINSTGDQVGGIYLLSDSNDNIIQNNWINMTNVGGTNQHGIWVQNSRYNNVSYNKINTVNPLSVGVYLFDKAEYNNFSFNRINTYGASSVGFYLYSYVENNNITNNRINTTNSSSYGIHALQFSHNNLFKGNWIRTEKINVYGILIRDVVKNSVIDNHINTSGTGANGIYIWDNADNNNVIGNTINTTNTTGNGIRVQLSSGNNVTYNTIFTHGFQGKGIYNSDSTRTNISYNSIATTGSQSTGVDLLREQSSTVIGNIIKTINSNSPGIALDSSTRNTFMDNTINTTNTFSSGISLTTDSSYNDLINNIIDVNNANSFGIVLDLNSQGNNLTENTIVSIGTGSSCINITTGSHNTNLTGNVLTSSGVREHGVHIDGSNNTKAISNDINVSDPHSHGFVLDGFYAVLINSTVNGSSGFDIVSNNGGNLTVVNSIFNTVESASGVIQVKNFLHIQAYFEGGVIPLPGADVDVYDNITKNRYYSTSGYGGSDSTTGSNGRVNYIIVDDRWYTYSNTAKKNLTNASVKRTIDGSWEGQKPEIDMNQSHTEVFIATDITAPKAPTGLTVTRIGTTSDVTVSWDANTETDMDKYSLESNKSGSYVEIANKNHPTVSTTDTGLTDETWYFYRLQAWDKNGFKSPYSAVVSYFHQDLSPPAVPTGFTVSPVAGGDTLRASWTKNSDDTVSYELWLKDPDTGVWNPVDNISHPLTSAIGPPDTFVHGQTYYFKLRAWDDEGLASGFTADVSVVHQDYVSPTAPSNVMAVTYSETEINLSWTGAADLDLKGYNIYMNDTNQDINGTFSQVDQVDKNTLTYNFSGLADDTIYYFYVTSYDEANNENSSEKVSERTIKAAEPQPPSIPVLDELPSYTNIAKLNVSGSSDSNINILVYNNNNLITTGSSNETGRFKLEITLINDENEIKVRARDAKLLMSDYSTPRYVILDTKAPTANAGPDINSEVDELVNFDGTLSSDNYGIENYTWSFDYGARSMVYIYGASPSFIFTITGVYTVTLAITDLAGNTASDSLTVTVTRALEKPGITDTVPGDGDEDVPVDITAMITFSLSMDTLSTAGSLEIAPEADYILNWSVNDTVLKIEFTADLEYETNYTLTVGGAKAKTGGVLQSQPVVIKFKTEKKPAVQPPEPEITINPPSKTEFEPDDKLTFSGTSQGMDEGTIVSVSLGDETVNTTIGADGSWEVSISAPETEGVYTVTVTAGNETSTLSITIKETGAPPAEEPKDEEDKGLLGMGKVAGIDLFLLIIIVIILVLVLVLIMLRRKKAEAISDEEEAVEEEDGEEDEEDDEAESADDFDEDEEDDSALEPGEKPKEVDDEQEIFEDDSEDDELFDDAEDEAGAEPEEDEDSEDEAGDEIFDDDSDDDELFEDEDEDIDEDDTDYMPDDGGMLLTKDCPSCGSEIEIPRSDDTKVTLECGDCGAKGKIANPYL